MAQVETKKEGHIAYITINRPEKRNALSPEAIDLIGKAAEWVKSQEDVRAVIITGSGDKAFSAGIDLAGNGSMMDHMQESSPALAIKKIYGDVRKLQIAYRAVENLPMPVIAAIKGYCYGAGMELILACDMRVASEDAEFTIPEVQLGVIPDLGGSHRLNLLVGYGKAKELILTGRKINAAEALRIGLIEEMHSKDKVMEAALKMAQDCADNAPLAVEWAKKTMNRYLQKDLERDLEEECLLTTLCLVSDDAKEGFMARAMRKKPDFKGR
jgi:enoyl-CoA hydratase/carnithine racemase